MQKTQALLVVLSIIAYVSADIYVAGSSLYRLSKNSTMYEIEKFSMSNDIQFQHRILINRMNKPYQQNLNVLRVLPDAIIICNDNYSIIELDQSLQPKYYYTIPDGTANQQVRMYHVDDRIIVFSPDDSPTTVVLNRKDGSVISSSNLKQDYWFGMRTTETRVNNGVGYFITMDRSTVASYDFVSSTYLPNVPIQGVTYFKYAQAIQYSKEEVVMVTSGTSYNGYTFSFFSEQGGNYTHSFTTSAPKSFAETGCYLPAQYGNITHESALFSCYQNAECGTGGCYAKYYTLHYFNITTSESYSITNASFKGVGPQPNWIIVNDKGYREYDKGIIVLDLNRNTVQSFAPNNALTTVENGPPSTPVATIPTTSKPTLSNSASLIGFSYLLFCLVAIM